MTTGKKLTSAFGGMLAVVLVLGCSAFSTISDDLNTTVNATAKRIEIAGRIDADAAEMRGAQRSMVRFSILKDPARAKQNQEAFQTSVADLRKMITEVRPILSTEAGRQAVDDIEVQLEAWLLVYRELAQLCAARRFDTALIDALGRAAVIDGRLARGSEQLLASFEGGEWMSGRPEAPIE